MYGKYHLIKKQYSWDSGVTWYDSDPLETMPSGSPISIYETYEKCIEEAPKFIFTKTDSTVASAACNSSSVLASSEVSSYNYGYASLEIGDCVTSIADWAMPFFALSSVTISDSVTSIGSYAFFNSTITSVTIGNSVETIGAYAFGNLQHITGFTIPSGVTNIGNNAFSQSDDIISITCLATTPPTLGSGVFENTNNCPIYVPSGSVNTYKSTSGWSSYSSRIRAIL